jgi:uncharacterized protein (DUF952 family)
MIDNKLYHITLNNEWFLAGKRGWYEAPSLGTEGFIHCSFKNQVADTANRYYAGTRGLVLLVIDPARLDSRWVEEKSTGDALYPHVYGRINLSAVQRVVPFEPGPDGKFQFPVELE